MVGQTCFQMLPGRLVEYELEDTKENQNVRLGDSDISQQQFIDDPRVCAAGNEKGKSGPPAVYLTTNLKQSSFKKPSYEKVTLYSQSITVDPQYFIHKDCLFVLVLVLGSAEEA